MKVSAVKVRAVVVLVMVALLVCIGGCSTTYWEYDSDYVINLNESLDEVKNDDVKIVTTYGYVMAPDVEEINTAGGTMSLGISRESFCEYLHVFISETDDDGNAIIHRKRFKVTDFDQFFYYVAHEGEPIYVHKIITTGTDGGENMKYKLGDLVEPEKVE